MNERSGVPKLQPANRVQIQRAAPWEFQLRRHVIDLKLEACMGQTVHRHDRESHVAHLEFEPCVLAPSGGEEHVLLATVPTVVGGRTNGQSVSLEELSIVIAKR